MHRWEQRWLSTHTQAQRRGHAGRTSARATLQATLGKQNIEYCPMPILKRSIPTASRWCLSGRESTHHLQAFAVNIALLLASTVLPARCLFSGQNVNHRHTITALDNTLVRRATTMSTCLHRKLVYGHEDPTRQVIDLFFPDTIELVDRGVLGKAVDALWHKPAGSSLSGEHARPSQLSKGHMPALLIFVHGGAWISENNTDHYDLGRFIAGHSNTVVALIDYRLSSKALAPDEAHTQTPPHSRTANKAPHAAIYHPDHIADVFNALALLLQPETAERYGYNARGSVLAGHSAGGWMVLATALDSQHPECGDDEDGVHAKSPIRDFPPIDPIVRSSIKAYVCVESIFSLTELLRQYPDYKDFVIPAFYPPGAHPKPPYLELAKAGVESWQPVQDTSAYYDGADEPVIFVFHSAEDTLLDVRYNHHGIELIREKGLEIVTDQSTFHGDHDDVLHNDTFWIRLMSIVHGRTVEWTQE